MTQIRHHQRPLCTRHFREPTGWIAPKVNFEEDHLINLAVLLFHRSVSGQIGCLLPRTVFCTLPTPFKNHHMLCSIKDELGLWRPGVYKVMCSVVWVTLGRWAGLLPIAGKNFSAICVWTILTNWLLPSTALVMIASQIFQLMFVLFRWTSFWEV